MVELPSVEKSKVGGKMNVAYEKHSIISAKQILNN